MTDFDKIQLSLVIIYDLFFEVVPIPYVNSFLLDQSGTFVDALKTREESRYKIRLMDESCHRKFWWLNREEKK